ncbi:hypothetical protein J6590_053176 [Homalodisca vitripennis]|nr:hypothetical protein J6590_053176 [Homalodisca vitripennis]
MTMEDSSMPVLEESDQNRLHYKFGACYIGGSVPATSSQCGYGKSRFNWENTPSVLSKDSWRKKDIDELDVDELIVDYEWKPKVDTQLP